MRPVSKKRARLNGVRRKAVAALHGAAPWCARCGRSDAPLDAHEFLRRSQGGDPSRPDVLICRTCHDWIGANPSQAVADGWAKWSWQA